MLRFAYSTAGCSEHRLGDALELMAEAGYLGVRLSLTWHHFDPFADDHQARAKALADTLKAFDLALVVETDAAYLMDPRERDGPTFLDPTDEGRARRLEFMRRALDVASSAGAEAVVVTSGRLRRATPQADAGLWLLDGLAQAVNAGAEAGVPVALQPSPQHMVGSLDDFLAVREALKQTTDAPLSLALDLSHCHAAHHREPHTAVKEFAGILATVSLADAKRGAPDRLPLGAGDMDIPAVLAALEEINYGGLVTVDLPGESSRAHRAIAEHYDWLQDHLPSD